MSVEHMLALRPTATSRSTRGSGSTFAMHTPLGSGSQSLERAGRPEEAKAAAAKALPILKRWLVHVEGGDQAWGRIEVSDLEAAIAHCEHLVER